MQTRRVSKMERGKRAITDELVTAHLWLVRGIAKKVKEGLPVQVELNDLIEDGVLGLIAAAQRYDPKRGIPFPPYARFRIRGAILDGLRRTDHLSRDLRSKVKKADADALENDWGRGTGPGVWRAGICAPVNGTTIARSVGSDTNVPEAAADESWRPDVVAGEGELSGVLRSAVGKLPRRYGQIVTLYHWRGLTMREIGRVFSINESRVSQIHKRALQLLAESLRAKGITSCASVLP